jgi:hypothetical protein
MGKQRHQHQSYHKTGNQNEHDGTLKKCDRGGGKIFRLHTGVIAW